ncbi:hypothetical protein PtA15_5A789 [Puccinia triticina]|uniref:Uncharacterized protein n=1 Tax=Puccinia triticina TaxID=208348 RepID=A0ABY7CKI8_9BASI|nr:uncharacterized protein PtA15_5A789 [Puccinia triticina]WAQ85215.1 hypothetical protein PtA15_5A789 [Puccinia triticina]
MPLNINDLLRGDFDNPSSFQGTHEEPSTPPNCNHNSHSPEEFETRDPNNFFDIPTHRGDIAMADGSVSYNQNDTIEEVCSQLQSSLQLDPEHLKIANIACKYIAEAPDAAVVFSNGAFHQLGVPKTVPPPNSTAYAYDVTFKAYISNGIDENPALELLFEEFREVSPEC